MRRLDASDPGFAAAFDALVDDRRESASDVSADVAAIIARVKAEGDAALTDYTARFDCFDLDSSGWRITAEDCAAAYAALAPELQSALDLAATRIRAYHAAQLPEDRDYRDAAPVTGISFGTASQELEVEVAVEQRQVQQ
jgi:histidinol dehydrogenase